MQALAIILTLFYSLSRVVSAERDLPATVQFDLVFPRNETYAPTPWFPIVFVMQNLDAVWPAPFALSVGFDKSSESDPSVYRAFSLFPAPFSEVVGPTPGQYVFYIPVLDFFNATTTGQYLIEWGVILNPRCNGTNGPQISSWESSKPHKLPTVRFTIEAGAQLPDIEAAVNSCPEPTWDTTTAVRFTGIGKTIAGNVCPITDEDIAPLANCSSYQPIAKELAANVSATILDKMGCTEGAWQTMQAPCNKTEDTGNMASRKAGFEMVWAATLAMAVGSISYM